MGVAIHYAVKAKLIKKKKENGEFEFLEVQEEFYNDNPILAREAAFKYYQNYIDVLLEAKGLIYESDKHARMALESFHNPRTSTRIDINGKNFDIQDSLGNGIGVFLIIDEQTLKAEHIEKSLIIHGMGDLIGGTSKSEIILFGLETEHSYYQQLNYSTGNYETTIVFCDSDEWLEGYRDDEPGTYFILKTPFDWTGMDKPYWWGEPEADDKPAVMSRSIEDIIANGETNQVEFKPSLIYNFIKERGGIGIKGIIAKSICAFLNSNGGYLFIGLDDQGHAQGLENDFGLSGGKNPRDFFRLEFDDTIKQFIPTPMKEKINGDFVMVNGVEIFVVTVFPSKVKPVFMNGKHGKEFWVRWTASTRQFIDIEDITNYCLEHWQIKN